MSPANKDALLSVAASLLIFVGCFAKPFGLPEALSAILPIAGGILLLAVIRMRKKVKAERERTGVPTPVAPLAARKKLFWILAFSLVAGSIGMLPLLPYTVDNFQPWIYYWVIPGQIMFLALFLPFLWSRWTRLETTDLPDKTNSQ